MMDKEVVGFKTIYATPRLHLHFTIGLKAFSSANNQRLS